MSKGTMIIVLCLVWVALLLLPVVSYYYGEWECYWGQKYACKVNQ